MQDEFWREPRFTFEERRQQYLAYCAAHAAGELVSSARLLGSSWGSLWMRGQFAKRWPLSTPGRTVLTSRSQVCCGIIYRYDQSPNIATGLIADIETCLLGFKYWWDEPGDNRRCYHTENHQILSPLRTSCCWDSG